MQLTAEVRRLFAKNPASILLQTLKIIFTWKKKKEVVKELTIEEVSARDKAILFSIVGLKDPPQ